MAKNKIIQKRILTAIPVLVFMAVIFAFSARTAEQSMENSDAVVDILLEIGQQENKISQPEGKEIYQTLVVLVRKGAHMAEYAVLCMLAALHLTCWGLAGKKLALCSVIFSALYAASDEFHQLFVEGRSGQATDVLIDTMGAVLGIAAFFILRIVLSRLHRNKTV